MRAIPRWPVLALLLASAAGCTEPEAVLNVTWVRGVDSGSVALPALALSCPEEGWLEVVGTRSDTGIGVIAFLEGDTLAGRYPVVAPEFRDDSATGVGGIAIRWFSADEVAAFTASDGVVLIERTEAGLSGRFVGLLQDLTGVDSVEVQGVFRDVPLAVGGIECAARADSTPVGAEPQSGVN